MPNALLAKKKLEVERGNRLISLSTVDVTKIDGKYYVYHTVIQKITNYIKSKKHKDVFFYLNVDLEMAKCVDNKSIDISSQDSSDVYHANLQVAIEDFVCEKSRDHTIYANIFDTKQKFLLVFITGIYQEYKDNNVYRTIIHYNQCLLSTDAEIDGL